MDRSAWEPTVTSIVIALVGLVIAAVGGWLGGELVERLGIGVETDAGPDAGSSLKRSVSKPVAR